MFNKCTRICEIFDYWRGCLLLKIFCVFLSFKKPKIGQCLYKFFEAETLKGAVTCHHCSKYNISSSFLHYFIYLFNLYVMLFTLYFNLKELLSLKSCHLFVTCNCWIEGFGREMSLKLIKRDIFCPLINDLLVLLWRSGN